MSTPTPETVSKSFVDRRKGDFWVNALLGAVVTVVLSFSGISPLIGGGIAGYLQQGTREDGTKVGAASGAIASVPALVVFALVFGFGFLGVLAGGDAAVGGGLFLVVVLTIAVVAIGISVGLSALGGYVGTVLFER
jgi:hypothetical protein